MSRPIDEPRTPRCQACPAQLLWARHATTGNRMPFDREPSDKGTWVIERGVARKAAPGDQGPRYTPHFATCARAGLFRGATS